MRNKRNLIVFSLIIFFSLGLTLGLIKSYNSNLNDRLNDYRKMPELTKHDPSNNPNTGDHIKTNDDNDSNNDDEIITQTPPMNKDEDREKEKKEDSYSPDLEYYKKAKELKQMFPNVFYMDSQSQRKRVALTFDDGPDNNTTPKILDILNQYNVPATFFLIGENAERYPAVVKRIFYEGHQVANHSWSHLRPTELSSSNFLWEVKQSSKVLQDYLRPSNPLYYRPPYGLLTNTQMGKIREEGYLVISWSIDSLDWTKSTPKDIRDKVVDSIYPGAIVLMHSAGGKDKRQSTVEALPDIIDSLTKQGYEFVTVHDLLNLS